MSGNTEVESKSVPGPASAEEQALDEAAEEWDQQPLAAGTSRDSLPALARASTRHDPLTTAVLAEIARQRPTVELSPEEIERALHAETIDEPVAASPNAIRRPKTP